MDRHELAAVGKGALNLHLDDHLGNVVHDVGTAKKLTAEIHQLGYRSAVSNEFQNLRGDQRDRFGIVQAKTAGETLLCDNSRLMKRELVRFLRCEMHAWSPFTGPGIIAEHGAQETEMVAQLGSDLLDARSRDPNESAPIGERPNSKHEVGGRPHLKF